MRLTTFKYDKIKKTKYVSDISTDKIIEKLGLLEDILEKNSIDNNVELERLLLLGQSGYNRIKLAMGHRIYFVSGKKIKRATLVGYANNGMSLDQLLIEKKKETAIIPYTHLCISKREAKRNKKGRQIYKLNKQQYHEIFKDKPFIKHTFLVETVRGTDKFIVCQKVFKAYFRTIVADEMTIDNLKKEYSFDLEKEYKEERKAFIERRKVLKTKWI